jgi:hypothetical protein
MLEEVVKSEKIAETLTSVQCLNLPKFEEQKKDEV